jgi:hypothetical protein
MWTRRLLPLLLIAPAIAIFLVLDGAPQVLLSPLFGVTLAVALIITTGVALLLGRALQRSDAERRGIEEDALAAKQRAEIAAHEALDAKQQAEQAASEALGAKQRAAEAALVALEAKQAAATAAQVALEA